MKAWTPSPGSCWPAARSLPSLTQRAARPCPFLPGCSNERVGMARSVLFPGLRGGLGLPLFAVPGLFPAAGPEKTGNGLAGCALWRPGWRLCLSLCSGGGQRPLAFVPGSAAGAGRLGRRNSSWALDPQGGGGSSKNFLPPLAPFGRGGGVPAGPFSGRKGPKGVSGEIFRKKGEKTRKKDLKNLCIPVYNRNNMGVLYQG